MTSTSQKLYSQVKRGNWGLLEEGQSKVAACTLCSPHCNLSLHINSLLVLYWWTTFPITWWASWVLPAEARNILLSLKRLCFCYAMFYSHGIGSSNEIQCHQIYVSIESCSAKKEIIIICRPRINIKSISWHAFVRFDIILTKRLWNDPPAKKGCVFWMPSLITTDDL